MTEEQAKTKWCPFSRTAVDGVAANRGATGDIYEEDKCVGSGCMAWRVRTNGDMGYDRNPDDVHDYYCGLAGTKGAL